MALFHNALFVFILFCFMDASSGQIEVPAIYHTIYMIQRSENGIAKVDAKGNGYESLYTSSGVLRSSLAFDGTYLYFIENGNIIKLAKDISIITSPFIIQPSQGPISCVGIQTLEGVGQLYYAIPSNTTTGGVIRRSEIDGTLPVDVATFNSSSPCKYFTAYGETAFWTTEAGEVYRFNTAAQQSTGTAELVPDLMGPSPLVATNGDENQFFYSPPAEFNSSELRVQNLDVVTATNQEPDAMVDDRVFQMATNGTVFESMITINTGLILSTGSEMVMFFPPFSSEEEQDISRTLMFESVEGMATDHAMAKSVEYVLMFVALTIVMNVF